MSRSMILFWIPLEHLECRAGASLTCQHKAKLALTSPYLSSPDANLVCYSWLDTQIS